MADVTQRQVRRTRGTNAAREDGRATRRLASPWRKPLVSLHIIVSVGLLGADAAVLLLCVAGARGADAATIYPAARLIGGNLLVPLALLALASGLALGLLTPWGVVRYWWVAIKLALTVAGTVLALLVLVPALGTAAAAASAGAPLSSAYRLGLVRDTAAASTVLIATVLLAVYKPFGRLRGRAH